MRLLKPKEVGEKYGLTSEQLTGWQSNGTLRPRRTRGGHRRFSENEIRLNLGAMVKRIRVSSGYTGNEATDRFRSIGDLTARQVRNGIAQHGVHEKSEYVLALPRDFETTVRYSPNPQLARMLRMRVLLISEKGVRETEW